jgi:hypothetical protein
MRGGPLGNDPTCIAASYFARTRDSFFIDTTVPGGGVAFLARCWVLCTADFSRPGFFIIATSSFRQDYLSIVTSTLCAMCAYGEA